MNGAPPTSLRAGDYVMNFPVERPGDRNTAREAMKRNGCRTIRFELHGFLERVVNEKGELVQQEAPGTLIAHGYVARMAGNEVEAL
jgi:hypothetical protein